MFNLRQRSLSPVLTAVIASSLIGITCAARADAEGPAPEASPSMAADNTVEGQVGPQFSEQTPSSSTSEPTFETETSRMTWPNVPLLATGASVFGLSYLPAVVAGALSDADGKDDLYIPLAGPWLMLTKGEDEKGGYKALLVADGITQGLGALMLFSSFFIPEKTTSHWYLIGSNDLRVAPSNVGTGYGMGAMGRF